MTDKKILFLSLYTFSQMGGIEKFNRAFLKALISSSSNPENISSYSLHDSQSSDEAYFPQKNYRYFNKSLASFIPQVVKAAPWNDIIILGHINLAPVGIAIKQLYPRKKLILITHGLEIWSALPLQKKMFLKQVNECWAVSNHTRNMLMELHHIPAHQIKIFPNTLDPFFQFPEDLGRKKYLMERNRIQQNTKVILSITRLSSSEQYKGYDKIIACMPDVLRQHPEAQYWIAGKSDKKERLRIEQMIKQLGLENNVHLLGFIPDEELLDHYAAADLFVMPSQQEGFGIVFIEAMACGVATIGGNLDGTRDALANGELGTLVNPNDQFTITHELIRHLYHINSIEERKSLQAETIRRFSFDRYKERMESYLN